MASREEPGHAADRTATSCFDRQRLVLTLCTCLCFLVPAVPACSQNNDEQDNGPETPSTASGTASILQPGIGLRYELNDKIKLYQDFREYYNRGNSSRDFEELSFGARYKLGRTRRFAFSATLGYLLSMNNNYSIREYRPKFYLTTRYRRRKVRLEFRNRIEYRVRRGGTSGNSMRYRPRFKIRSRYGLGGFRFSPYIYEEFYIDANGLSQNRTKIALGVGYHDLHFTVGNLFKFRPGQGLVQSRASLDVSYTIP